MVHYHMAEAQLYFLLYSFCVFLRENRAISSWVVDLCSNPYSRLPCYTWQSLGQVIDLACELPPHKCGCQIRWSCKENPVFLMASSSRRMGIREAHQEEMRGAGFGTGGKHQSQSHVFSGTRPTAER